MARDRLIFVTVAIFLIFGSAPSFAETYTDCYRSVCAIITVPNQIIAGEKFDLQVEGYIENSTSWDVSAYALLKNSQWNYTSSHMVNFTGERIDVKGFHWGGSFSNTYRMSNIDESTTFTFLFGSRQRQMGYYDVAIDVTVEVVAPSVSVAFDIKPQSCPNPFNVDKKGVLSAAIVGSVDFDVQQVYVPSIQLAGVSPIHVAYEDVTEPYLPLTGKRYDFDCTDYGSDGHMDLTLKFRSQDVYEALRANPEQSLADGENVKVALTGQLLDAFGGTAIWGEDVIRIISKKSK